MVESTSFLLFLCQSLRCESPLTECSGEMLPPFLSTDCLCPVDMVEVMTVVTPLVDVLDVDITSLKQTSTVQSPFIVSADDSSSEATMHQELVPTLSTQSVVTLLSSVSDPELVFLVNNGTGISSVGIFHEIFGGELPDTLASKS